MSVEAVRAFLEARAPDIAIIEHQVSTATVQDAALAHCVVPERIAKTLMLKLGGRSVLVVTRGDARLDNRKAKAVFGGKIRMAGPDEVLETTGHPIGGVCPFGLTTPLEVFCDVSLKAFDEVVPAAGSTNSSVRMNPLRMAELVNANWVDVSQVPDQGGAA